MAQGSRYTTSGVSFFSTKTKDAGLWREAPHPLLISPLDGYGYFNDFFTFGEDAWTTTAVSVGTGTSTIAMKDADGGVIRVNCAANENDGAQAQSDGECVSLENCTKFWFDARVNLTDEATQSDAFVGLATVDASIIASAPNDIIYWHKDDGDTNWDFTVDKSGGGPTNALAEATAAASTWVVLGFYYDGSSIWPYVDGVQGTEITTNIPDDEELMVSFGYLNGAGSAQNEGMDIDWIRFVAAVDRS